VLWAGIGLLITLSLVRTGWIRRAAKIVAILGLAMIATECACREIQEKWRIRGEWADAHPTLMTPADHEALAVDGANLTLGPLIRGFRACMLLVMVAVALPAARITVSRIRWAACGKHAASCERGRSALQSSPSPTLPLPARSPSDVHADFPP
jgi:hypothetical protein